MAFSGIPLPRTVADVGPGGPLVTGLNALNNYELQRSNALYNPLKTVAQASSQLAYSNLMGPQFLAKLMNNPDFVASMKDPQKAAQFLQEAASQPTGANALGNFAGLLPKPSIGEKALNYLLGKVGLGEAPQPQQSQNALMQKPAPMQNQPAFNPPPGQSAQSLQGNQGVQIPGTGADSGMVYDKNGNNIVGNPEEALNRNSNLSPNEQYAEAAGKFKFIKNKMETLGKLTGDDIHDMDKQYTQAVNVGVPMKHLMDMAVSPTFMNTRNKIPFFQDKQLHVLSKIGTPEEQKMIGDFITSTKKVVADTITSFPGRILDKEVNLANQMKINDNDTWNVMMGKLASLETFNEITKQRANLTSKLMKKENMTLGEAQEVADKQINGDVIRKGIEEQLNPKPQENDIQYMMNKYGYDRATVMKKLKAKGH